MTVTQNQSETPKKTAKTTEGEWLHAATYTCVFTPAGTTVKWTVDDWINTHRPSPFIGLKELGQLVRKVNFKPGACLLDGIMPYFVTLPPAWDWSPAAAHPPLLIATDGPLPELQAAIPLLLTARSEIQAREKVGTTLNLNNVTVGPTKGAGEDTVMKVDWKAATRAGRQVILELLGVNPEDLFTGKPEGLNAHLMKPMCDADPKGLGKLLALEFIDLTGKQGNAFRAKAKGLEMKPDNSADLNTAYNHLRFVLYMEYLALRQMIYGK
ncbi:hypothetical protein [Streptomyces adustus]|uniref:hypothetical protein n=1 Tax=Streptomyces adustus TaxID=1609272 RepID=UPI0037179B1C